MILVIGGAGYIGSQMCRLLRDEGEEHIVFDSLVQGHREAVQASPFVLGDLRNRSDLDKVFRENKIDVVMHFAAHISVGESVREPAKYWDNNTCGVITLLEAMRAHGVDKFVFSSTAAIFGEPEQLPIDEDHPQNPTSPYGATKMADEAILRSYDKAYGLKSVCLRYFNAAGADPSGEIGEDHHPEEHLVPLAIFAAMGKRAGLKVFGTDYPTRDGTCVRDYIHILDLADAHLLGMRHLRSGGDSGQYNLGNGQGFTVRDVIRAVEEVSSLAVPHEDAPRRPGDPATLVASSERIREDWGWKPRFPQLVTIVETAWKWHRANPDGFKLGSTLDVQGFTFN